MSEQEVPRVATPISVPHLVDALRSAWATLFVAYPSEASLDLLASQWAFETGWGKVGGWNWNLGNRKHVAGDGRDWFWLACTEVLDGAIKHLSPPDPGCRFCSFTTLDAGALDYLSLLHGRFGRCWSAIEAGDPHAFAEALKAAGYYTDTETHYESEVVGCLAMVKRMLDAAPTPIGDIDELAHITDLADRIDAGDEGLHPDSTPPEVA